MSETTVEYSDSEKIREIWALFKETDYKFKETDKKFQETDRKFKETEKNINRLSQLFESQWGKLMESLAEGGILNIFQQRGIGVYQVYQRAKSRLNGRHMEIDLLLVNDTEVVAVEVKTTLKADHVEDFLVKMKEFPVFFHRYIGSKIYGAVAALRIEQSSDRFAEKNGLFVIKVGGDGLVTILNAEGFMPKVFGQNDE